VLPPSDTLVIDGRNSDKNDEGHATIDNEGKVVYYPKYPPRGHPNRACLIDAESPDAGCWTFRKVRAPGPIRGDLADLPKSFFSNGAKVYGYAVPSASTATAVQGWTSTLMSNPTRWHAQFRRQLPSSNK
jgi:hypothetical protein